MTFSPLFACNVLCIVRVIGATLAKSRDALAAGNITALVNDPAVDPMVTCYVSDHQLGSHWILQGRRTDWAARCGKWPL
jgi:hypothetical protein